MYITSTSLICPVGLNATSAYAAIRAGITGFTELPYVDSQFEPVMGAAVASLDLSLKRKPRVLDMINKAVTSLIVNHPNLPYERVPLLLGLAEPMRPGGAAEWANSILSELSTQSKQSFHPRLSQVVTKGHVSSFEALQIARRLLDDRNVPACVVAAVDSSINATTLNWLEQQDRLKTTINSNGVIPGEAAGAVLVQRTPEHGGSALRVAGLGFAMEKTHVLSEEPFLGLGLAQATRNALNEAGQRLNQMDFRLSDVTGESYGFKEQALTLSRVLRQGPSQLPLWHCADAIGDVGAVAGICQWVVAENSFREGHAPGPYAISSGSSVGGERAVAILRWEVPK